MQVQNKKSASIFYWKVKNFGGVEIVEHEFKDGKPCIIYGKNGAAKSGNIKGIYRALKGKAGYPGKIDNPVGPYSISKIKKAEITIGVESKGDYEILEVNGTKLKRFFIHFSETEKGNVSLKVTDDIAGSKAITAPRDKIDALTGMFLDPLELVRDLEQPNGDRLLAEKLAAMVGQDLTPYALKDNELFEKQQDENRELIRLRGEFATLDVPQDDWAKEFVDPAAVSKKLQELSSIHSELAQSKRDLNQVEESISEIKKESEVLSVSISDRDKKLTEERSNLETLKVEKAPVKWEGTEDIEAKIRALTEELTLFREHEKKEHEKKEAIENKAREIERDEERLENSNKELAAKKQLLEKKETEHSEAEKLHIANTRWASEIFTNYNLEPQAPEETLSEYLKRQIASTQERMTNIERDNDQVKKREAYELADQGIKAVEQTVQDLKKQRKENAVDKSKAVAAVKGKFPHPGITVDFKNPNLDENDVITKKNDITVWVDFEDGRGRRTINDISEGERLRICTYIIIAGNTGPLDIIIIRDGALIDSDSQNMIFTIAKEHGYHVILETIETSEAGALHIVAGKVESINQPVIEMKPKVSIEDKDKVEKQEDDSEYNW
jgi:hypothetical protein